MQQEKNKKCALLFWILTAVCMVVIFYFSSRTADESNLQSDGLLALLTKIFGENSLTIFMIRKTAHLLEFTGLCVLFNSAWYFTKGKRQELLSIGCTSLYAVTDEIHQIFVDGRSCEIRDWGIDTLGALLGATGFVILFFIIDFFVKKKKAD